MGVSSGGASFVCMAPRTRSLKAGMLGVAAAVVFLAGCGTSGTAQNTAAGPATRSAPPVAATLQGEPARAAGAVDVLARALRNGDVERLCRPGAVFTSAVVGTMNQGGESCEASLERSPALRDPPTLTVTSLAFEPGLARAQVRIGGGRTIPLDVVRSGHRWLVSFSNGADPLAVIRRSA
jgi:hypothetical protein